MHGACNVYVNIEPTVFKSYLY